MSGGVIYVDDNDEVNGVWWLVERICGFKVVEHDGFIQRFYLVKWVESNQLTWEPFDNLSVVVKQMVRVYMNTNIANAYPV